MIEGPTYMDPSGGSCELVDRLLSREIWVGSWTHSSNLGSNFMGQAVAGPTEPAPIPPSNLVPSPIKFSQPPEGSGLF